MLTKISNELFKGWNKFEIFWILFFLAIQCIIFAINPSSIIDTVAAITGILCVIFVSKGKISNYIFGFISVSLYAYIAYTFKFYGDMMLSLFVYIPVQFIGFYTWSHNLRQGKLTVNKAGVAEVIAKSLNTKQWVIVILLCLLGTFAYSQFLKYLGGNLPFIDGLSTVVAIVAQILMIMRYKEQWILWILVNILTIALWTLAYVVGNETSIPILAMYIMYLFNSIYGYVNWIKLTKSNLGNC